MTPNEGKEKCLVPVLAPLLSIVIDQDSPDLVLNDFMAVGFNFHLSPKLGIGTARGNACILREFKDDRRSGMDLAKEDGQELWRWALAKIG